MKQILLFMAVILCLSTFTVGQTYQTVYTFPNEMSGDDITSPLVFDTAGNAYGTSFSGGSSYGVNCSFYGGCGIVFKIAPGAKRTTLHNFGLTASDGQTPYAGVVLDAAGNLYGTTFYGGAKNLGTVFKLDGTGKETILHTFNGQTDGANPKGGLLLDPAGNLYGTTEFGGDMSKCSGEGCGTIFQISASGQFKLLYTFTGGKDGGGPVAALIRDSTGNLYGTALSGGTTIYGVVFKLSASGTFTLLHPFKCGASDGGEPSAPLSRDAAGNLYGTTTFCGVNNAGTVFKLDTNGNLTLLHSFSGPTDGQYPTGGLAIGSQGTLYGTTSTSGPGGFGTLYSLDSSGSFTVLHNFAGAPNDGAEPDAAPTFNASGTLYGTAAIGGSGDCPPGLSVGCGTIFKFVP
ncbi:MAG TPA: choice-of-anchor tandem repeat GloVer-containing protein [Terriglobales bacterium]|nr:choice-of-anchor tandem repeat GloVer-containing protein [Terriglobales bacterium]